MWRGGFGRRGAEMLQDAKLDGGDPISGPLVLPGT
jgi:hypothetical protein